MKFWINLDTLETTAGIQSGIKGNGLTGINVSKGVLASI